MFGSLLLAAALALAPEGDVAALKQEVEVLKKAVAEAATQEALAKVDARLERLAAELERTRQGRASDEDLRRAVDSLETEVHELERRVAAQRVRSEDILGGWPASAHAGYDQGFTLRGDDDRMLLRIGGYAQLRFDGADVSERTADPQSGDRASFLVRRARLDLSGHVLTPQLTYRLLTDFAPGQILLQDAWAHFAPHPVIALQVGKFKTPYGREPLVADNHFMLVDRADATDIFRYKRDLGVMASTSLWNQRLRAHVAMQNGGVGENAVNDNIDFVYAARVIVDPLGPMSDRDEDDLAGTPSPLVSVGGSFLYDLVPTDAALVNQPIDVDGDGTVDNVARWQFGGDAAFRWRGFSVQAEYFRRVLDYGAAAPTARTHTWGAYGQVGYFILPGRVEVAARYSYAQPNAFGLTVRQDLPTERHVATAGATWLFFGRSAEAQLEYDYLDEESVRLLGGLDRITQRVRAQIQLGF